MATGGPIEERRMYEIRKYNFATGEGGILETLPKKVKGPSMLSVIEEMNRKLTKDERGAGISWYRQP